MWKVTHLGLSNYTARFTQMTAELAWDAEHPEQSRITATIDPTSVRTDFPFPEKEDFDKKIGTSEPFLAGKPISFTSTSVKITGANQGIVAGDLTLRGETHPATIEVTFNGSMAEQPMEKSPKIGFSGILKFKRSEWGLAPKIKSAGEEVTVIIETEFQPASAARQ
ncbi:polyisoprenoid-binding protein YceI [Rhizobium wenxiniae]|uniref:Polyisoprenoid-binding protein YceI n=1 Tax=Rhizobium wenxiniae TaxID=1737357 RepID=A0A7X0D2B2_9HYPH|nr:polyisoprenoid-binding protein YceI [Rhizobium wenxiniae]